LGVSERIIGISITSYGKNSLDLRPTWVTTSPRERIEFVSQGPTVFVQKAYGNEGLNRSNVFTWYCQFRDGRELVEEDEKRLEETVTVYLRVRYKHLPGKKNAVYFSDQLRLRHTEHLQETRIQSVFTVILILWFHCCHKFYSAYTVSGAVSLFVPHFRDGFELLWSLFQRLTRGFVNRR
jgi:hypothetical protein